MKKTNLCVKWGREFHWGKDELKTLIPSPHIVTPLQMDRRLEVVPTFMNEQNYQYASP